MSACEFRKWLAMSHLDPFGEERADLRIAILTSVVANLAGAKSQPRDWMPRYGQSEAERERELIDSLSLMWGCEEEADGDDDRQTEPETGG